MFINFGYLRRTWAWVHKVRGWLGRGPRSHICFTKELALRGLLLRTNGKYGQWAAHSARPMCYLRWLFCWVALPLEEVWRAALQAWSLSWMVLYQGAAGSLSSGLVYKVVPLLREHCGPGQVLGVCSSASWKLYPHTFPACSAMLSNECSYPFWRNEK